MSSAVGCRSPRASFVAVATCAVSGLLVILPVLRNACDRLLGYLAGWAIWRTPKAFRWTIECICVRPSFSWRPHAWSEITLVNWTWHDPPDFGVEPSSYILHIDRLMLRLELASIYRAIRYRQAVQVDMLLLEGVRFRTCRNQEAALNLWEALDLPDRDVNVSTILRHAREQGRLRYLEVVRPLPPTATEATREASGHWQQLFGEKRAGATDGLAEGAAAAALPPIAAPLQPPAGSYFEYPIGDPRRRPRWGVPLRFNIRNLTVVNLELWLFDLLTRDRHQLISLADPKITVGSLSVSREALEARDARCAGAGSVGDGVHGVYLGELVWVLIGKLLPKILQESPSGVLRNAVLAVFYGVTDSAVSCGARILELALDSRRLVCRCRATASQRLHAKSQLQVNNSCHVHVHLIMGRGIVQAGQRVNVHARCELSNPLTATGSAVVADQAESALRVWTKTPWWNERFTLGPVSSVNSTLRVACFHRNARHASEPLDVSTSDRFIGQVILPLETLLIRDRAIAQGGEIVGWFPLTVGSRRSQGRVKLGLRVIGAEFLPDVPPDSN